MQFFWNLNKHRIWSRHELCTRQCQPLRTPLSNTGNVFEKLKTADKFHPIGHPDHVIMGGFDGDALAYQLLKDKYIDADGVQDVFFECQSAVRAIIKELNGEPIEEKILDPGFVIHQHNISEKAEQMWGAQFQ